jgi:hypothetical protein
VPLHCLLGLPVDEAVAEGDQLTSGAAEAGRHSWRHMTFTPYHLGCRLRLEHQNLEPPVAMWNIVGFDIP